MPDNRLNEVIDRLNSELQLQCKFDLPQTVDVLFDHTESLFYDEDDADLRFLMHQKLLLLMLFEKLRPNVDGTLDPVKTDFLRSMYFLVQQAAKEYLKEPYLSVREGDDVEDDFDPGNESIIADSACHHVYSLLRLSGEGAIMDKFFKIWQDCLIDDLYKLWFTNKKKGLNKASTIAEFWTSHYIRLKARTEAEYNSK